MTNQPKNFKLNSILIGSLCITLFVLTPIINLINLFCFAGVILGGLFGAIYYCSKAKQNQTQVFFKDGIIIGVLSGLLSAVIVVLISLLTTLLSKENPINEITEMLKSLFNPIPNEMSEVIQHLSNEYETLGYSPTLMVTMLVMNMIMYPIFGMIGGILGIAIKRRGVNSYEKNISV